MMRRSLLRGVRHFSYVPVLALAAAISFAKLLLYARLMGVESFGSLSKILLVSAAFGMAGSLGLQSIVSRDLPALFARSRVRRGLWLLGRTMAVTTLVAGAGVLTAMSGIRVFDLSAPELAAGLVHGWSQQVFLLTAIESRSRLAMGRYGRDMLARSAAVALAGASVAGLGGGAAAITLIEIVLTLLLCLPTARAALQLAHVGWPWFMAAARSRASRLPWGRAVVLLGGTLVLFVSLNLDRWVAAEVLPKQAFGQYAFAWLSLVVAQSVQGLLNASLLPLLARRRAQGHEASAYRLTRLLSLGLLALGLVSLAAVHWALVHAIHGWMPQYAGALPLLLPLLLAGLLRVADFWSSLLVVVERESVLLAGQLIAAVCAVAGYAIYLRWHAAVPTPVSLAWLAVASALASHGVSAASVIWVTASRSRVTH